MTFLPAETLSGPEDPRNVAIEQRNAALRSEIRLVRGGFGDGPALLDALAASVLYVPLVGGAGDVPPGLTCVEGEGVLWVLGFTDLHQMARYHAVHGPTDDVPGRYLTVVGDRLLHAAREVLGGRVAMPSGLALDIAGDDPMVFPPVLADDAEGAA